MFEVSSHLRGIVDDMEASTSDVASAVTMPREAYTSEAFFELEKEAIYMKEWLAVGHQSQIPNPGDYFSLTLADEPVILVRTESGAINALSGVCRHRGFPLTTGDYHAHGNCHTIVCPYHKWAYDLEGEIVTAPHMRQTIDMDSLKRAERLPKFRVELIQGFIFINFDKDAAPLKPQVAKFEEAVRNYNFENMLAQPTIVTKDLNYNWKILHENALEPYHTLFVHAGYHEMAPATKATFMDFDDGDGQIMHPTGFIERDAGFNPAGKALFPILPGLGDLERSQVLFGSLPPTLFFCCLPDQVFAFFVLPTSATRTTLLITWLFPEESIKWPRFQWAYASQSSTNDILNIQDQEANEELQKGLKSRFGTRGRYSHLEKTLPQFNRWIYLRLRRFLDGKDAEALPAAAE